MQTDPESEPNATPAPRERPRILQPTVLILAWLGLGYIVLQMVLMQQESTPAAQSRKFDALVAMKPDLAKARAYIAPLHWHWGINSDPTGTQLQYFLMPNSMWARLQILAHEQLAVFGYPPRPQTIGYIRYQNGKYVSAQNRITGVYYRPESTTATKPAAE